jgi:hypothetical protein
LQIVASLKTLFKWQNTGENNGANTDLDVEMPVLKQLKLDKKITSASEKVYLILAQVIFLMQIFGKFTEDLFE